MNRMLFSKLLTYKSGLREDQIKIKNPEHHINELGINENDLITSCMINKSSCKWSKILTPDGVCYAFNLIPPDEMFQKNL